LEKFSQRSLIHFTESAVLATTLQKAYTAWTQCMH